MAEDWRRHRGRTHVAVRSKLIGATRSVEGFHAIGEFLAVNPSVPRIATGVVEITIALLLIVSLLRGPRLRGRLAFVGHVLLLGTMAGALFTELIIRPGVANMLLVLATILAVFASVRASQSRPWRQPIST